MAGPGTMDQPAIGRKVKAKGPRTKRQLRALRFERQRAQIELAREKRREQAKAERENKSAY